MLYEPPKTKKYILIGAIAIVLAVLVIVAAPLIYRSKTPQTPVTSLSPPVTSPSPQEKLQQDNIQKEFEKLEAMRKSANAKQPTSEDIQKEFAELEKQRAQSGATPPTQEQIQAEFDKLEKMRNLRK